MKRLFQKILTFILALITGLSAPVGISEEAVVSSQQTDLNISAYKNSRGGIIIREIEPQSSPTDIVIPEYIDGLRVVGVEASALIICDDPYDRYALSAYPRKDIKSLTVPYSCDILRIGIYGEYFYWPLPLIKCEKYSPAHKTLFKYDRDFEIINDDGTGDYMWLDWVIKDGEAHITGMRKTSCQTDYYDYDPPSTDIVFPSVLEGCPVVSVDGFYGEESLYTIGYDITSIVISDSIETIKKEAFFLFNNIEKIHIGKNVKTIEEWAFKECYIQGDVIAGKNIQEIGPFAFMGEAMITFRCYKNSVFHNYIESYMKNDFYNTDWWAIEFIDESHLASNVAKIDESGNVTGLPSGLTKETVTDFLAVDGDASMEISDDVIGTGTVIELINSEYGTVDNTYTVIMDGDINGDGNVNTTDDVNAIRKIITGNDAGFTASHKKAADLNGDGLINSTDLVLMKSMQS